ncbi:hypothetical protein TWF730_006786 [Orbilia blumenaviensis]|uniref:Uncharacterized protein n=1 Tax=Orbilia blumenaviensis TaxID=1796055 RepID=A0AAV9VFB5_9PEZI
MRRVEVEKAREEGRREAEKTREEGRQQERRRLKEEVEEAMGRAAAKEAVAEETKRGSDFLSKAYMALWDERADLRKKNAALAARVGELHRASKNLASRKGAEGKAKAEPEPEQK